MAGTAVSAPTQQRARLKTIVPSVKPVAREPLLLLMSIVALLCCSLELEILEQVDSMMLYMTVREILWDGSAALVLLLLLGVLWWLALVACVKTVDIIVGRMAAVTALVWHAGITLPLSYFVIDVLKATRLRLYPHWHLGFFIWLWLGPGLLILCAVVVFKTPVRKLQHFCGSRLAPLGWVHVILAIVAISSMRAHGVHIFRNYALSSRAVAVASTKPNIYLITIDTLRAEDMSLYGYSRRTTPELEKFAKHATTFDYFFANSNFTTATTTSIETGKLPWSHKIFHLGGFLRGPAQKENLAELLQAQGYYTSTISGNEVASPVQHRTTSSYDSADYIVPQHGFSAYYRYTNLAGLNTAYTLTGTLLKSLVSARLYLDNILADDQFPSPAEPVFARARALISKGAGGRPQFLWTHVLPPHDPYLPPVPYRGEFLKSSKLNRISDFIGLDNQSLPRNVSVEELRARYDEDIAYTDHAVGEFLDWLDHTGRLANSLVLVSADHGESFENGWYKHTGPLLSDGLIHIPLLVHLPGQTDSARVTQPAQQIDILPTILELIKSPSPSWVEGTSLVPALHLNRLPDRFLFAMNLEPDSVFKPISKGTIALINDRYKYVADVADLEGSKGLLFDYRSDPSEQRNLSKLQPDITNGFRDVLLKKLATINAAGVANR